MDDETLHPWESDGGLPWETDGAGDDGAADAWRGTAHLADWPEDLAGPEYWLFKRASGEEE